MVTFERRAERLLLAGGAAVMITIAPTTLLAQTTTQPSTQLLSAPCTDGVIPGNPYVVNCNLPTRQRQVIGAAPDAGAIIACRDIPGCLSYYVNYKQQLQPFGGPSG